MDRRLKDAAWLRGEYVDKQRHARLIAEDVGCSKATVYRYLGIHGIPIRSKPQASRLAKSGVDLDEAQVARLYAEGYSTNDLEAMFRSSKGTILAAIRRQGVRVRSKQEAGALHRSAAGRRRPHPRHQVGVAECAICGEKRGLEQHHVNADRTDSSPSNLIWLCWEHHVFVEWLVDRAVTGIRRRVACV